MLSQQDIFKRVAAGQMTKDEAMILLKKIHNVKTNTELCEKTFDAKQVQNKITDIVINILHIPRDEIKNQLTFKELGIDSISGVEIIRDINGAFNLNLDAVALYDYSTITILAEHILQECTKNQKISKLSVPITRIDNKSTTPKIICLNKDQMVDTVHEKVTVQKITMPKVSDEFWSESSIQKKLFSIVCNILHIQSSEINTKTSFKEMGVDSISGVEIIRDVNTTFDLSLDAVIIYDYTDISALTKYIAEVGASNQNVLEQFRIKTSFKDTVEESTNDILYDYSCKPEIKDKETGLHSLKHFVEEDTCVVVSDEKLKLKPINESPQKLCFKTTINSDDKQVVQKIDETKMVDTKIKITEKTNTDEGIAVIGMSGRFPGAENLKKFWSNMENGVDSVKEIPKNRWDINKYYDPRFQTPNKTYCRMGGYLDDVEMFDPLFFNISPREAEMIDPQQRIFLEEAWKAFEDAGYSDTTLSNVKCGVFVGSAAGDYSNKLKNSGLYFNAEAFTGVSTAILAARISYFLNLKGPSISMDTACSSSLVAIHLACQSILSGECDMALAGGVRLMFSPDIHIQSSQMGILSPEGKSKAFDQSADGTVLSEGVGAIVLKPLSKAIEDRDYIYGVIKASGINQDGKTNGITAPSVKSQLNLELEVYKKAGINPERISYIETHGTGTKLGDPIEVKALTDAFREYTQKTQFCALGSVKTNIGHTTMASGVASVIKVLLSMKNKKIPPSLHFKNPNEHIDFKNSPFYVNTELTYWNTEKDIPRLAAISSFGFSGTNCHMLIEEAPSF